MKKNLSGKHRDHKGKKLSRTNHSKLRKSKKTEVVFRNPGPSPLINKGEDGKIVITNIVGKVHQKEYTTKIGKDSRQENKTVRQAKKDLVKQILAGAGFDPTVHYTRKEKKKFTRIVKSKLFVTPKPVTLSEDEIRVRIGAEKSKKEELLKSRKHISEILKKDHILDFVKKRLQPSYTAAELSVKENPENRKFTYTIQRRCEDNPMRDHDFATDYFEADSRESAFNKAKELFKKYLKKEEFTGIRLKDSKDNAITYYPKGKLAA